MAKRSTFLTQIVKPPLILALICLATALLLAVVNNMTAEPIRAQEIEMAKEAKQLVMPDADKFQEKSFVTDNGEEFTYDEALDENGEVIGYVFNNAAQGYGGLIEVNLGVDINGIVTGAKPLSLSETPGIGSKVGEDNFLSRFQGKSGNLTLVQSETDNAEEVETISGATTSCEAFMQAVQVSLDQYAVLTGGNHQ